MGLSHTQLIGANILLGVDGRVEGSTPLPVATKSQPLLTGAFRAFSAQVFISCGGEIVATILRGEEVRKGGGDGLPEVGNGSRRRSAQRGFELGEGPFDGIEVGTVRRQVAQGSRPARSMNQNQANSGIPYNSIGQCPSVTSATKIVRRPLNGRPAAWTLIRRSPDFAAPSGAPIDRVNCRTITRRVDLKDKRVSEG